MSADRRDFLTAGAAAAAVSLLPTAVHAKGNDTLKVGLIGCGGRGSGAIDNCMTASTQVDAPIKLWAIGDVFEEKVNGKAKEYATRFKDRAELGDRVFSGVDAYQKVIDSGVDLVILATPPGFRPVHLEAAVKAKKHVFCEKPVAVDGPGIRKCLSLVEEIKKNGTALVAGTQRRHQKAYLEVAKQVQDKAIGDIVAARCSWNGQGIWFYDRKKGESDAAYQMRNWYHFLWICGDHIVEQHVHNLDVINWLVGSHPIKATGMGGRGFGRKVGDPAEVGNIWDHFAVEYEYADGTRLSSYCRHFTGVNDISEMVIGTKGTAKTSDKNFYLVGGKPAYSADQDRSDTSPYVLEHVDLLNSIRSGKPLNELQSVTESTLTAILGREAAYSGRTLKWDEVLNAKTDTMPPNLTLESSLKVPPVPVPGKYKV